MMREAASDVYRAQRSDLAALAKAGRLRCLSPRRGADFASNDYLGFASADFLRKAMIAAVGRGVPAGSGGSRLLRGNHPELEALEREAAAFFGSESALFLGSGYAANSAFFATVPQRGDLVLHDALVHASVHEGLRLSRAEVRSFAHGSASEASDVLASWRASGGSGTAWIAIESVYSMDGDLAPLQDFAALAGREDAVLVIDEAHATGIFGEHGKGLAAAWRHRCPMVTLHTCGKALGCEGALLCGPAVLRDHLINRARGFIYSTAPSPLIAATIRAAIAALPAAEAARRSLFDLCDRARGRLEPLGARFSGSPIVPLLLGDDRRALAVAQALCAAGHDCRAIRPPTVAPDTARLRIALTLNVDAEDVDRFADALERALA